MGDKYQAYPEYKDSGVEWLGKIPPRWNCVRLKYCADLKGDKVEMGSMQRYVGMENIESGNGKYIAKTDILPEGLSTSFSKDDVLFGKLRPYLAKSWLADFSGICSSEFLVLRSLKVCPQFLNYYTLSDGFINQVDASTYGSKMPRASWDFIGLMAVPVPANESEKIANFLDHETAKIDTLIEKQQQLIKLLKEKRQAVISHAVTKGLNPNAKMRDSGVEWLGEVPEHWEILKGGFIGKLFGSESIADDDVKSEGDIPFIKVSTLSSEGFELHIPAFFVDRTVGKQLRTSINYVVFPKRGAAIFTNKVNIVKVDSLIDPNLMGWDIGNKAEPQFIAYLLKLRGLDDIADISTVPQINNKHIEPIKFPVPPISEQREIIDFLSHKINQLSDLINKTQLAIELVQERRTALISAAVTGKIDVRNWHTPNG